MKRENRREVRNSSPASNDGSISRKRFVLFSAMTLPSEEKKTDVCCLFPLSVKSCSFPLKGFPVSLPPLFPVLSLSPSFTSCSLSLRLSVSLIGRQPRGMQGLAGGKLWQSCCLWERKTTLSRFLLFCLKLEAGVAYLSRTEILVVEKRGCCYNYFLHHHFLHVD